MADVHSSPVAISTELTIKDPEPATPEISDPAEDISEEESKELELKRRIGFWAMPMPKKKQGD